MSLQSRFPQSPSQDTAPARNDGPASSPYWEEPASSPYWDAPELADYAAPAVDPRAGGASADILSGLTEEQQRAVQHTEGPLIIVAGPGAGKTLVIVRRIAHLVRDRNVAPWRILAVTFTNKAAREMRERLGEFLPNQSRAVTMGTFHAVCARILRRHGEHVGLDRNFTIYDQDDQIAAVKSAMRFAEVDDKRHSPRSVLSRISAAKNKMQDWQQMAQEAYNADDERGAYITDICARAYRYYEEALSRQNAVDFDDLLLRTKSLLENVPEVQALYHERYQYLMIDEFQDTNEPQYRLVRLLTGPHNRLCVVGDVDQSIYSWRGATIENYEYYKSDFPDYRIKFALNFRSGQAILDAAESVISGNTFEPSTPGVTPGNHSSQSNKRSSDNGKGQSDDFLASLWRGIREWLWGPDTLPDDGRSYSVTELHADSNSGHDFVTEVPVPANAIYGDSQSRPRLQAAVTDPGFVSLMEMHSAEDEAQWALGEVTRLARSGQFKLGDCAIMYRTNAQSRAFEELCLRQGVPYRLVGGVRFYNRKEIKDTVCYLRVIYNPGDEVSLQRIINTPPRGIGTKTVQALAGYAGARGITMRTAMREVAVARAEREPCPIDVTARASRAIADLSVMLDRLSDAALELGVADLLDRVLDMSGLAGQIQADDNADERQENIQELRGLAEDYGPSPRAEGLGALLERVSLVSDVDGYDHSDDAITLITLHQAKGLEFPVVMMVGMEEGLLPHVRSMDTQDEMDEERRLCYVGMTRAQKRLYLSFAYSRRYRGTSPSPFLYDLPSEVRSGTSLAGSWNSRWSAAGTSTYRSSRNDDVVIGGSYAQERRASRTRLGDGSGTGGDATRGRLRGNIDERLTEWTSSRRPQSEPEPERVPLAVGEIVRHPTFGEGVVQEVEGSGETEQVTVNFPGAGLKRLLVSLARLERG